MTCIRLGQLDIVFTVLRVANARRHLKSGCSFFFFFFLGSFCKWSSRIFCTVGVGSGDRCTCGMYTEGTEGVRWEEAGRL